MGKPRILAVDDDRTNLRLFELTLRGEYDVLSSSSGAEAVAICISEHVDLVLLDIMMPEVDGYQVCRFLKEHEKTRNIPVIFVSARDEVYDETAGLDLGAVDYITKPIVRATMKARIRTHLSLKKAREELEKKNELLEEYARLRDDVERITRHDLKGPLNAIINLPWLITAEPTPVSARQKEMLDLITEAGYRMLNMINSSLDMYKMETGTYVFAPNRVDIVPLLRRVIGDLTAHHSFPGVTCELVEPPAGGGTREVFFLGEEFLSYTMLSNLIHNALEASAPGETVRVSPAYQGEATTVAIHNHALVPAAIRGTFFDKYVTAGKAKGTGLGTYSARLIARTQGGDIVMASSEGQGTLVTVTLPSR